jgi:hypothetical protein
VLYAGGKLIGTYDSAGLHFHFDDPLGTRGAEANASGVMEAGFQSLPYGDGLAQTGSVSDPTENYFSGKERDAESETTTSSAARLGAGASVPKGVP